MHPFELPFEKTGFCNDKKLTEKKRSKWRDETESTEDLFMPEKLDLPKCACVSQLVLNRARFGKKTCQIRQLNAKSHQEI